MASHSFLLFLFPRPVQAGPVLAQQPFCFSAVTVKPNRA